MKSYFTAAILTFCLASCSQQQTDLHETAKLELKEASGLEYLPGTGALWALEDSGNANKLYKVGNDGKNKDVVTVLNAKDIDWEDLASDPEGNLYIGDFGNNDNDRKDLAIYKLDGTKPDSVQYTIKFHYPDQKTFPPKKSEYFYDCEAFFELNGNFYLFTKNRSAKYDGTFHVYKLPNKPGNYAAELVATLKTCSAYRKCAIAGADISPDGKKAVLVTGDKIFLFTNFGDGNFKDATLQQLDLGHLSQKEGICFKDDDTLLIADEKDGKDGGKLYEVKLSELQAEK